MRRTGKTPVSSFQVAPLAVVNTFMRAVEKNDFQSARRQLADTGFCYRGPLIEFSDADAFIADIQRVGTILKRIERRRVFVDGDEVLLIQDVLSTLSELAHTRVANWFSVERGRIRTLEVFYDTRAYASLFEAPDPPPV